ncbi:MAG: hypothetical protein WD358_02180 [Nitriliruptoraceae bacterium]
MARFVIDKSCESINARVEEHPRYPTRRADHDKSTTAFTCAARAFYDHPDTEAVEELNSFKIEHHVDVIVLGFSQALSQVRGRLGIDLADRDQAGAAIAILPDDP